MADGSDHKQVTGLAETLRNEGDASEAAFQPSTVRVPIEGSNNEIRYVVGGQLGAGATGRVFEVTDQELGRDIAVKVLAGKTSPRRVAAFLHEARMAASLEHPNIPPIYDVSTSDVGQVWFSMRRSDGISVQAALDQARIGQEPECLVGLHRRVGLVIQVAQALQAAHAKGILHRDVKPANIMLGRFGEVLLVDWGTASSDATVGKSGPVGTPLYMSPQQSQGHEPTASDDVYALGATLFELLTLRPPLQPRLPEEFWRLKALGTLDDPSDEERRRIPRHLLAIARRALAVDPQDRYPDVKHFSDDLARWQAGQSVSACRDTIEDIWKRWWRQYRRQTAIAAFIVIVFGSLVALLWGERLKERATWGQPVISEDFNDETWRERFNIISGSGEVRDGRMVSTSEKSFLIRYEGRLQGPTAIEFEGEMLPGSNPCDLSLIWSQAEPPVGATNWEALPHRLKVQFGAYDGAYTALIGMEEQHLTWSTARPEIGRRHRIRVEIVADRLRLVVDGREIIKYRDAFPLEGGTFALYGYYPDKAFDHIRVYNLGLPERLPATAIGDAFAVIGDNKTAIDAYRRVIEAHPESAIAAEARYRLGLCQLREEEPGEAFATWESLAETSFADDVRVQRLAWMWDHEHERRSEVRVGIEAGLGDADPDARVAYLQLWGRAVRSLANNARTDEEVIEVREWLALRERIFPDDNYADRVCAEALLDIHDPQAVIDRYPGQERLCALAWVHLGRPDEAIRRYPGQLSALYIAYLEAGCFIPGGETPGGQSNHVDISDFDQGHWKEIPIDAGSNRWPIGGFAAIARGELGMAEMWWPLSDVLDQRLLMHRGDAKAMVSRYPELPESAVMNGDVEGAVQLGDGQLGRALLALRATQKGDSETAQRWFHDFDAAVTRDQGRRLQEVSVWMGPFCREQLGEAGAYRANLELIRDQHRWNYRQRPWYTARYLLGDIDDAGYLNQPWTQWVDTRIHLLRAVRADHAGAREDALVNYRKWLALPSWARSAVAPTPEEAFARWRVEVLSQP